ncbi:hypothetical protein CTAYLR_002922 [Chrysophaeum taylorii]|uniref:Minichromosome loss protein Mcl1 middle region domain-containing protein n=1 Tax=Chrysophaeum taylorii TaxID=2483200 RepID=A0AAD7UML7_9STRA|nr:hypothetical protein CTAYLR_002922 [Chrysophaeum taylorii]
MQLTDADGISDIATTQEACACLVGDQAEFEVVRLDKAETMMSSLRSEGSEALVRRVEVEVNDEELTCIAAHGEAVGVGDSSGRVRVWAEELTSVSAGSAVRALAFSGDGGLIAAGLESGNAAVAAVGGTRCFFDGAYALSTGCTEPISCVAWNGKALAACDAGGRLEAWAFDASEELGIEARGNLKLCRDAATLARFKKKGGLRFAWSEQGEIAAPGRPHLVVLPDARTDWESGARDVFHPGLGDALLACAWAGDLVAAASLDGKVAVWRALEAVAVFDVVATRVQVLGATVVVATSDGRLGAARVAAPKQVTESVDEDEDMIPVRKRSMAISEEEEEEEEDEEEEVGRPRNDDVPVPPAPLEEAQAAFMPGATDDAEARFLYWSSRGAILARRLFEDEDTYVIEMEHYSDDAPTSRTERFTTKWDFSAAALGSNGAVFARNADDNSGVLSYHPIGAWDALSEWQTSFEPCECVAAGTDWVAALTSRRFVRLYSAGGVADAVVSIPGNVVSATGRANLLAVAYHCSATFSQLATQEISVVVYDVYARTRVADARLPLAPRSKLAWLAFSDDDLALFAMDDDCAFYALVDDFGWSWAPVLDAKTVERANPLDRPWPVYVSAGSVFCATLKGGATAPAPFPRPILEPVTLDAPISAAAVDKTSKLAERQMAAPTVLARHRDAFADRLSRDDSAGPNRRMRRLATLEERDADAALLDSLKTAAADAVTQRDKALLHQLVASLKNHRLQRALDLARRLARDDSLDLALRLADAHGVDALTARVENLLAARDYAGSQDAYAQHVVEQNVVVDAPRHLEKEPDVYPAGVMPDDDRLDHHRGPREHLYDPPPTEDNSYRPAALSAVNNPFKLVDDHHAKRPPSSGAFEALGNLTFSSPEPPYKKKRAAADDTLFSR